MTLETQRHAHGTRDWIFLKRPMPERVKVSVSRVSGYSVDDLKSERRPAGLVYWRHICAWLLYRHTKLSFPQVGSHLGGRDHTTAMYAVRKIEANFQEFESDIRKVEAML